MEPLPGNSHSGASSSKNEPDKKRVERVVHGEVTTRKPSFGRRLRESFFPGHAETVGEYVLWDVLVPSIKDVVADMGISFMERMLFGDSRSSGRRPSQRGGGTQVSYQSMSGPAAARRGIRPDPRDEPRTMSARGGPSFDLEEIVFGSRIDAESALIALEDAIGVYRAATVADLYDIVGLTGPYTAQDWGWANLDGVVPRRAGGGWVLDLPRVDRLK